MSRSITLAEKYLKDKLDFEIIAVAKEADTEESAWKKIVNKLRKHRQGQHDQSTHGGKSGFNVPANIDIEGKRFNQASATEFTKRLVAYEQGLIDKIDSVSNDVAMERFGKPYSELTADEESAVNRSKLKDGKWTDKYSIAEDSPSIRDIAKNDPEILILKENFEDHFLMKDAMNQLAWNEDGTLGPNTIGQVAGRHGESHADFTIRMLRHSDSEFAQIDDADYSKRTNVLRRDEKGNFLRDEDNGRVVSESVLVSREVAERIHGEEWKAFGEAAYPEVIVSNKALRSILASGEFKTYTEANRPARAGGNDAEYKNARSIYESVAFGYDNTIDTANRPVSGMLTAFDPHQDLLTAYGNTQVILKPSVLPRTTVTYGDSLNGFYKPETVTSFLSKPKNGYQNKTVASDVEVNGKGYYTNRNRGIYNTPEIQIHGGVSVSDIASVVFRDTVPAALSTKLDGLGIPYEVRTIKDAQE
jgi:hypothetical protein